MCLIRGESANRWKQPRCLQRCPCYAERLDGRNVVDPSTLVRMSHRSTQRAVHVRAHLFSLCTAVVMSSVLTLSACHSSRPEPASVVNAADEATAGQLYAGFYAIEQHSWRWASKNFAVMLKPP